MNYKNCNRQLFSILFSIFLFAVSVAAQTNEFTYQGKLSDSGTPSATYDFEFRLCDSASDCTTPLATQQIAGVPVTNGVFTIRLNFGAVVFDGSNRWREIAVKRPAQGSYTTLSPRQPLTSAPYAIRTLNAGIADNSVLFGGLTTNGFVQNTTTQQTGNFNLSGNGTLGGTLQANEVKALTAEGNYGLTHTAGIISLSSYIGGSGSGASGAWFGTQSNHPLHFFTNNGQPRMTIDQAGSVGIGTFTPSAGIKLDVNGSVLVRTSGSGGNIQFGSPNVETGLTIINTNRADVRFDNSTLKLLAGAGTAPPSALNGIIINTLGNVGIGTNSPGNKLDVAGNIFASGSLNVGNGVGIAGGLSVSNGASITGDLNVGNGAVISNGLNVSSGNLNVSGAGANLNVASGITLGFVPSGGDYGLCYKISTKFIANCSASSLRYKQDVSNFDGGLSIVNRLRPISFSWKDDGRRDIGFAAEEVEQIEPLLTFRNERGEIEGVKYQLMGVVLVKAVKEQQVQIERQRQQIERQQTLLETQQKQLDALTQFVCLQNPQAEICKEQ